ncbi:RNA polymerase sigma factor [Streptomyces sp. NPDC021093]|uniref:RNA polymerase sigma factor n=1 Tax=Streptomyces sp. NPDC021093 TaxID=3365112 RepID=UPI0037AA8970
MLCEFRARLAEQDSTADQLLQLMTADSSYRVRPLSAVKHSPAAPRLVRYAPPDKPPLYFVIEEVGEDVLPPVPGAPVPDKRYGDVDGFPFELVEEHLGVQDFQEFCTEHRGRLIGLVRKVFRDSWFEVCLDPEDVVQDTMELAWFNWPRIGRMAHPDRYLRRVAAKKALRAMEKAGREVFVPVEGFLDSFEGMFRSAFGWSPEDLAAADRIRDVLAGLPQRQAQVLLLTADGWSDSQVGNVLGLSPATVRSHRRHMKKFLRYRLGADAEGWSEALLARD